MNECKVKQRNTVYEDTEVEKAQATARARHKNQEWLQPSNKHTSLRATVSILKTNSNTFLSTVRLLLRYIELFYNKQSYTFSGAQHLCLISIAFSIRFIII